MRNSLDKNNDKYNIADRIIEEQFQIEIKEENIEIGSIYLPAKSKISGNTNISIISCRPVFAVEINKIGADLMIMIQENFAIITPQGREYPLEFNYCREKLLLFKNIKLDELSYPEGVHIEIKKLHGTHNVIFNPTQSDQKNANLDEKILIDMIIKLMWEY